MSAIIFCKNCLDQVKKIYTLGDDRIANAKKIFLNILGIISFVGSFFSQRMGVNTYAVSSMLGLSAMSFFVSYKTNSKNIAADKSKMKYQDFQRTKEQENVIDLIMEVISMGREGITLGTFKKIAALAPGLYAKKHIIHYRESGGKILGLHTLRNLGYILGGKENRQKMKVVMGYTGFLKVVKTTYLNEMREVLNQLNADKQIEPYLYDFVKEVTKIDNMSKSVKKELVDKLTEIVHKKDENIWEEFIQTILKKTS